MKSKMAEYEKSINELDEILQKMSLDEITLSESVALYARAAELIKACTEGLKEAQVKIEEIDVKMSEMGYGSADGV